MGRDEHIDEIAEQIVRPVIVMRAITRGEFGNAIQYFTEELVMRNSLLIHAHVFAVPVLAVPSKGPRTATAIH